MPQLVALLLVLLVDSPVAPHFWQVVLQDGRLFGSPIDILNRAAPVALLAIGMTLVIATGGIDLRRGGDGYRRSHNGCDDGRGIQPADCFVKRPGHRHLAGLWNGILVAILKIQPFVATLILMVAGRGVAQLITAGQIVTFNSPDLMVRQWIAVVPANAGHYRGADAYPVLAVDPQNGAGDVYRSRWYQHSGGKMPG